MPKSAYFSRALNLAVVLVPLIAATGCDPKGFFYNPFYDPDYRWDQPCNYSPTTGYYCNSIDGEEFVSRDLTTALAQVEEANLNSSARRFAAKFELSHEQGLKIAKTIHDFDALQTRNEQDVADFARRLYGVDPQRIVGAVREAQIGERAKLDALVDESARNFGTSTETMREIVKTIHSRVLSQSGIEL